MDDFIKQMQAEIRSSMEPTSVFFQIGTHDDIIKMLVGLEQLKPYGLGNTQMSNIGDMIDDVFHKQKVDCRRLFVDFNFNNETRTGCITFGRASRNKYQLELIMPGIIAASAPGFLDSGFSCQFVTPHLYR